MYWFESSINLGPTKNILGTFNPPSQIWVCPAFLDTLDVKEMRSGVGEILSTCHSRTREI